MRQEQVSAELCHCLAVRQAARKVTQLYDQCLAPAHLRTTQFSILAKLKRLGPMTINELAADLVMDRTTLGRNIRPLIRDGLIAMGPGATDRRRRELAVTAAGRSRVAAAVKAWARAQARFEGAFGITRARELRTLLREVAAIEAAE